MTGITPTHIRLTLFAQAVVLCVGVALIVMLSATVFYLASLAQKAERQDMQAARSRQELLALSRLVVGCVTAPDERKPPLMKPPRSDCYVRQQAQQEALIAQLREVAIAAAACGTLHGGDANATRRCVADVLVAAGGPSQGRR